MCARRMSWESGVGGALAPLAAALSEVEDLVVMPSGAMLGVPVEALVTRGRHLCGRALPGVVHAIGDGARVAQGRETAAPG